MNLKFGCCLLAYVIISLVDSKSLPAKNKNKHAENIAKEPKKRISTQQKIGSGHAKGPMANNVQSSVPLPVVMPFPMIPFDERYPIIFKPNGKPKKGREKKKDPKGETEDETDKDVDDDGDQGEKEYKGVGKIKKGPNLKEGSGVIENQQLEKQREEDEEEAIAERKEDSDDNENSDEDDDKSQKQEEKEEDKEEDKEEEKNKSLSKETMDKKETKKKSKRKSHKKVKSRERRAIYKPIIGNPEDIMPYLMFGTDDDEIIDNTNGHVITTRDAEEEGYYAQETEDYDLPHDIRTREVDAEEEEEEEEDTPHVINTREVNEEEQEDEARDMKPRSVPDEIPDLQTAEKKFKDTQVAADVLTQIEKALGANPESSVEETHSLADILRKDEDSFDEEIAKDIIATQNAQTRSKIIVSDDGGKGNTELNNAKRKLENDRAKERQIREELKELKDIELMTTQLELAKYLATENARHQLQFAQALNRGRVESAPQPAEYQTTYTPLPYQQPSTPTYSYMPAVQEVQIPRQPVVMATPWQPNVYPQAVNYAFNPSHFESGHFRNEFDNVGKTSDNQFGTRHTTPFPVFYAPQKEAVRLPQTSYAQEPRFQQAIETPRPAVAFHTEAQSRHVTKPTITKPKQTLIQKPYSQSRFYPKPKAYSQSKTSNMNQEQPVASLMGRKPSIIFPGPTYSPPPFTTRTGRPKNRYVKNGYNSYMNRYGQPQQNKKQKNPALMSFFNDQHQVHPMANLYQSQLVAQQHMPVYANVAYRAPIVNPERYHIGEFHTIEKEQPNFNIHSPFIGDVSHPFASYQVSEYSMPRISQQEQSLSKTQIPASSVQSTASHMQPADSIGSQHGVPFQYALPRPQGPSFGAPAPVIYQAPSSYSESIAASKGGIPSFYSPYYSMPQPLAPAQFHAYAQTARPFETMNTDSEVFHGDKPPPQTVNHGAAQSKVQNPDKVPLGYGLFPLPDNAQKKMDEDSDEQKLFENIKSDTAKLHDTQHAAEAVTKIENKVGFDPGSIAKLVDFVKQAAEKDVDLSERAMKRDQTTIKKMEIGHVNDKKSQINNENSIAMKEVQEKLKIDSELLKESKDRLDKVKRMELIITGIEAAKYSALNRKQNKLAADVNQMNVYRAAKKTVVGRKGFGKRAS